MTQFLASPDPLLINIILVTLAIGLPILVVLSIRLLWDRKINIGRSKELEKLIWQLHRIASALEHQMNLSFPPVQPGTAEPGDRVFVKQPAVQPSSAAPSAAAPASYQAGAQPPSTQQQPSAQQAVPSPPTPQQPSVQSPQHAGVNSMFGFER